MSYTDLNGEWTGVFDYAEHIQNNDDAAPFRAIIHDSGGHISGMIIEPNTFIDGGTQELQAVLDGAWSGEDVRFLKIYDGSGDTDAYEILYEGTLDPELTCITGIWLIVDDPDWYGPFVMNRAKKSVTQKDEYVEDELHVLTR
jgi:hypothetical protein